MSEASVDFRVLGPLEVIADGRELTPARPKQRALLAVLLLRANQAVASEELIEALWGKRPPHTATTALRGHVAALRKLLGQGTIEARPPGYLLRLAPERSDLGRFQALLDEASREPQASRRAELLGAALVLFRGEPLADFRYQDFARAEIQRLEDLRLLALEERIEAELELGRSGELVDELRGLVAADPLRERLWGQLMLALYRAGRQAEALHAYQDASRILAEQLGLDPGPALKQLEGKVRAHDPDLAAPARQQAERTARPIASEVNRAPGPRPQESDRAARPGPRELDRAARPRRERKLVTVLFCDLAGFTARSEHLDPEDLQAMLESYFARVREQVERFGGTLEKFIGDAVMAVFGAPAVREDDPERAVRAALAIRDTLADELELRIGVQTGEALVTIDADPDTGQGIVVGDVVNTASRLQGLAPTGGAIVGEATYRATEGAIEYRELEPLVARGKRAPVPAWEARRERVHPARLRPEPTLVGRGRELDQLSDALSRAQAERSVQLATILGIPGIGKTRLVRELHRRVDADVPAFTWLQGRSLPYGDGIAFWALGEIVKQRAGIFEGDPPQAVEEKLRLVVAETPGAADETRWMLRHLRALVGLGAEGAAGGDSQGESFTAWRMFLEALAEQGPLVLVFEDLHWADDGLLDFVDELSERATDVALLVVSTSRPELVDRRPAWGGGKRNATTISLPPLSEDETEVLLEELLEGTELRRNANGKLAARAGGNPLYAEEYARLLLAGGAEDGVALPDSLYALIAARLDGLPAEEKALVQDASVIGETVWAGVVAAIGGRALATVEKLLRPLERKEFLVHRRRSAIEGESEYTFRHVLVRDVAYAQIPRSERGAKHRLAATWIESLGRGQDHAELLAHHYLRALELAPASEEQTTDLRQRARRALTDAGDRATALGALSVAARHFESALEQMSEDDPERPRLLLRQGRALLYTESSGEEPLRAASEASTAAGDRLCAAMANSLLGILYQEEGRGEEAQERTARALELVDGVSASRDKCEVLARACRRLVVDGEAEAAARIGYSALEIAEELGLDELRAHVLTSIGLATFQLGDVEGAIRDLERGIEIASAIRSPHAASAYGNMRVVLADAGDLTRAAEVLAEGQRHAERFGLGWYLRGLRFERLEQLYVTGSDWDELLRLADELVSERSLEVTTSHWVRARIALARGDDDGALSDAEACLNLARESTSGLVMLPALAIASLVDVSAARTSEAAARVDELLALLRSVGPMQAPFVLPTLSVVLDRLGRDDELVELVTELTPTPWSEAASAYAAGDFAGAAETYARIGARFDEAYARLRAAERLVTDARREEVAEQLEAALAFFRSVDATAYIREAQTLLATRE